MILELGVVRERNLGLRRGRRNSSASKCGDTASEGHRPKAQGRSGRAENEAQSPTLGHDP
jgi:hypothetical protein